LAVRLANDAAWRHSVRQRIRQGKGQVYRDMRPVAALGDFLAEAARRHAPRG
jgi:hypothetical protein